MTNKPIWTDQDQVNYEAWERAHGREPPPMTFKAGVAQFIFLKPGESMSLGDQYKTKKEDSMKDKIWPKESNLPAILATTDKDSDLLVTNPSGEEPITPAKRTRRPKGLPENVTVLTYHRAIIDVVIPALPEGMEDVKLHIIQNGQDPIWIDWPEGKTALEAIKYHFQTKPNEGLKLG